MGLGGGPNGAKATFKHKFASAFRDFDTLTDARTTVGVSRAQTLVVVDGNVLVMQTPSSVDTFAAYVGVLVNQINGAIQAGAHVVVVFDEPGAMTRAKQEEQKARDARRTPQTPVCSDDLVACPTDDNYRKTELEATGLNVRLLINHRPARARFYDALCVAVLEHLRTNLRVTEGTSWSVTFDGVDGRGADRPQGAAREVGILSSHPEIWDAVLAREQPIGEGDLKLTDVCHRVYQQRVAHPDSPLASVLLNILWTIDTDSFLIELLQQSRREARPEAADRNELTLLCLREPARKRKGEVVPSSAYFQCIDMQSFYDEVMAYVYGANVQLGSRADFAQRKQHTAALLAASVALCGCDFVQVRGMRCDLVLPCVRDVARNDPAALQTMAGVFTGNAGDVRTAGDGIRAVIHNFLDSICGLGGRMNKTHDKASAYNDLQILRACWITSYWLGYEFKEVTNWGFCHAALDTTEGVGVEMIVPPPAAAAGTSRKRTIVAHEDEEE